MIGQIGSAVSGLTTGLATTGLTTATSIGTMWDRTTGNNESMNINDWSQVELQNFVKWFIEVNYPDAVKQYQAIRDIERQAEKVKELELEIQQQEFMKNYWANQARSAQSPYSNIYQQSGMAVTIADDTPTKQESIWDAMKRMAGYGK